MVAETTFAVEGFGKRIRAMTDEKLERTNKAARHMCDPRNSAEKRTVRRVYIVQFRACRAGRKTYRS
jgi:ribosomal protein L35